MRLVRLSLTVVGTTLGITFGVAAIRPLLAHAPRLAEAHPLLAEIESVSSLEVMYRMRDRMGQQLQSLTISRYSQRFSQIEPHLTLSQLSQRLHRRISGEEAVAAAHRRAKELAIQAIAARASTHNSSRLLRQEEFLWQAAIHQLESIPENSMLAAEAQVKLQEYERNLAVVAQKADHADSAFLAAIAEETGRAGAIRISLCHLSGECRDYQGSVPPASPASLIKLPIAIALMHKVAADNIDLNQIIYIDPHNWTENSDGAQIYVEHEYPLREVMARMINESNNIATNQLIDYLGWDYINATLREMGYPTTQVNGKLVGENTYPTRNRGRAANIATVNDLSEMMRQVYLFRHPGDREILDALVNQYDLDFGYKALQGLDRKRVHWIGEKTGQNSKVIGSTLAVKIDNHRYVLTVTIDHSANQRMLRQVIGDVVQHILDDGHLVAVERG